MSDLQLITSLKLKPNWLIYMYNQYMLFAMQVSINVQTKVNVADFIVTKG